MYAKVIFVVCTTSCDVSHIFNANVCQFNFRQMFTCYLCIAHIRKNIHVISNSTSNDDGRIKAKIRRGRKCNVHDDDNKHTCMPKKT